MDIVINAALREDPVADRYSPLEQQRERMIQGVFKTKRGEPAYLGEIRRTVPAEAQAYHPNLLHFLQIAWARHLKVALAPQHLWYTLLNGLAGRTKAEPEAYRALFTTSTEKQAIVTTSAAPGLIDLAQVKAALKALVPTDVEAFLPSFTTSTAASDLACLATFCDAVTPYYEYFTTRCGIPAVRLLGTQEDWRKLALAADTLATLVRDADHAYASYLHLVCDTVLNRLVGQFDRPDPAFMEAMFKIVRCGSGHDSPVEGWIVDLFVDAPETKFKEIIDFPSHVAKVPFTDLPSKRAFDLCYGLFSSTRDADGFFTPEFSSVTYERPFQG